MPEPAFREHVVEALSRQSGVTVTDLGNGDYQIAQGDDIKVIHLEAMVPRNYLGKLERWYRVPRAEWYPPASFKVATEGRKTDAAG